MGDKLKKSKLRLDKAEEKLEKAQDKIPKKKVKQRLYERDKPKSKLDIDESSKNAQTRIVDKPKASSTLESNLENAPMVEHTGNLHSETPKKKSKQRLYEREKPKSKLDFDKNKAKTSTMLVDKPKPTSKLVNSIKKAPMREFTGKIHSEISKNEDDNVGVKSAHSLEKSAEFTASRVQSAYHSHKLKPYKNLAKAEKRMAKSEINHTFQKKMSENLTTNPLSRYQQKRAIKKQYAKAHRAGTRTEQAVSAVAKKGADVTVKAISAVIKNPKVLLAILGVVVVFVVIGGMFSSCSVLMQGGLSSIVGTSYTSEDEDIVEVDDNYTNLETQLQEQIDNIESDYPDYDEYRYNLDEIGHNPHELASYLTALLQTYKPSEVQQELQRILDLQYILELESEVEIRYRTETRTGSYTDSEGNSHSYTYTVEVPYEYYILNVTLTKQSIKEIAPSQLNAEQLEMFNVLLQSSGNKPLIFGGGSTNSDTSTDLSGVVFVDGERTGNQAIVDIAKSQVGNVGGQPYWSWYGFNSRVEWCATFVSWVLNQAGYSEPKFAACQSQGVPYFTSRGQWANRGYSDIAAGDVIFFDWQGDGKSDHVGIVIGTDGNRVYTVEGNSGDACKIRDYDLNSSVIMGYGLMN